MSRVAMAFMLTLLLLAPVAGPVVGVVRGLAPSDVGVTLARTVGLAGNTALLAGGAGLVAVPVGAGLAVGLERVRVPGGGAARAAVLVGLFVPLPIYGVAWQVVLGAWLPPLTLAPGDVAWRPWAEGLVPAAWVHGVAGVPWVVWVVAAGLRAADRGLEEDAAVAGGPGLVVRRVLLPRAAVAAAAAGGWVAVQAATEIPVTDAMMVRTYAEEVYTQIVSASAALAGAVAAAVPVWLAAVGLAAVGARAVVGAFGAPPGEAGRPVELRVGAGWRVVAAVGVWGAVLVFAGLPVAALVWKAGGGSGRAGWEATAFVARIGTALRTDGGVLLGSGGAAVGTGLVAAGLAWMACWLAGGSRWFTRFLFVFAVALAVTPGPLVGLGLKETIDRLVGGEEWVLATLGLHPTFPPVRSLLYDQPSPVPAGWAAVIRLFPVAVAVVWPAVRAVPRDLIEQARLDGLTAAGEWRTVVAPLTGAAAGRAVLAVAALALGEVSAGKLVNPPFRSAYVLRLFDQMHYGAESTVAALSLVQLAATALAAGLLLRSATGPAAFSRTGARSG